MLLDPGEAALFVERRRLERLPRHHPGTSTLLGPPFRFVDAGTFLASYREIFEEEVYRFSVGTERPRVIDCGANVGLAVAYFKRAYPDAVVTALEPDPTIAAALEWNIGSLGLENVSVIRAAAWVEDGAASFLAEGAHSGMLRSVAPSDATGLRALEVPTVRLRDILNGPIDFLKLDIEGAELAVLDDSRDRLANVAMLFVEYHGAAQQPQRLDCILKILEEVGFRYQIRDSYVAPHPFVRRPTVLGMELQLEVFAYRPNEARTPV